MALNPFAVEAPETVESVLESANATCARFNNGKGLFVGHYLAIGRLDGPVVIVCVETKDVLRWFDGHVRAVTSVSWSPYNRYLASSSLDWNVIIWDLRQGPGERTRTLRFDSPVRRVQFCPISSKRLLVVLESQQAFVVNVRKRKANATNGHANGASSSKDVQTAEIEEVRQEMKAYDDDGQRRSLAILSATFTVDGRHIVVGTSKGELLIFDCRSKQVIHQVSAGSSGIREISFDRTGRSLVTNGNDRSVRLFTVTTRRGDSGEDEIDLAPSHKFQDLVNRTPWLGVGFSNDGEYVFGGAAHKIAHNVYIWDRGAGVLFKILSGPRDLLVEVDWHPSRPMLATVSNSGAIYLWFTPPVETWSAYAPDFEELEENVVYEEREDEFDLEDEEELTRRKQDEEEAFVEIRPHPSRPIEVQEGHHPSTSGNDEFGDDYDDDDDDQDEKFIIPVRLSLDLPDLEAAEARM